MSDFRAQVEVFGRLKGILLPLGRPHELERFAAALQLCDIALRQVDMATVLDDRARFLIGTLEEAIDWRRLRKQPATTIWALRAGQLSAAARRAFAEAVDELADWFARQPRPATPGETALGLLGSIAEGIVGDLLDKLRPPPGG